MVGDKFPTTSESAATHALRVRFEKFVRRHLDRPHVAGVAVVGSVATGEARPDSDVDAYVFLDRDDPWLVPAEAIWVEADDTFHSIFADDPAVESVGLQVDLHRLSPGQWHNSFSWPELMMCELQDAWWIRGRPELARLVEDRITMPAQLRRDRVDRAVIDAAGLIPEDPESTWARLGEAEAVDRLQAGFEALVALQLARRARWLPHRGRLLRTALRLPGVATCQDWQQAAIQGAGWNGYLQRAELLSRLLQDQVHDLAHEADWSPDPVSGAFRRVHDESGRAWNLAEWNRRRSG